MLIAHTPQNTAALESSKRLMEVVSSKLNTRRSTAGIADAMIKTALTDARIEARIEVACNSDLSCNSPQTLTGVRESSGTRP